MDGPVRREEHGVQPGAAGTWPFTQIEPFLHYILVECGLAANTAEAYQRDLNRFSQFCASQGITEPTELTTVSLAQHAKELSEMHLSTASIARHLAAVRMFLRFQVLMGVTAENVCTALESPKTWRRLPGVLSRERTKDLITATDPASGLYLRDRALLELLYATGIRASEAAQLGVDDINFQVGYLRCLGKGNKERIVPVHSRALQAVRQYLEELRPRLIEGKRSAALFVSRRGEPLSRVEVWRIVRKTARLAGLTGKVSPHTLRHCFGSHLLQGGADLRSVQEMLGHADVTTTQIYTQVDQQYLRKVHKKYHPRP